MDKESLDTMFSSKSNEWETPKDLFDKLNSIWGPFTLDAAATDLNHKVSKYFTIQDDALVQDWSGNRVFLNPPYGRELRHWVEKSLAESLKPDTRVVMLIPARTDTTYWHDNVFSKAKEVRFIRGRIKFGSSVSGAPFPSAVVVFEGDVSKTIFGVL